MKNKKKKKKIRGYMVTVFRKVFVMAGTFLSFFPKKQRLFIFF